MAISRACSTQLTLPGMETSTSSSAARPASRLAPQEAAQDSTIPEADSCSATSIWSECYAPGGSFGKMFPVSCRRGEDGILVPSSGAWQTSGMVSHTGCSTRASLESPSVVVESSLSDILEATQNVPPAYSLSAKACAGILRRAEKRGKKLPPQLEAALRSVASGQTSGR